MIYQMQAIIIEIRKDKTAIGRMSDGTGVLFPAYCDIKTAAKGDTFSFIPEETRWSTPNRKMFFGRDPKLVSRADQEFTPEEKMAAPAPSLLPCRHARHFDPQGRLILGPRPCELEAQRKALRGICASKHAPEQVQNQS